MIFISHSTTLWMSKNTKIHGDLFLGENGFSVGTFSLSNSLQVKDKTLNCCSQHVFINGTINSLDFWP
jgi:hypothetical protein